MQILLTAVAVGFAYQILEWGAWVWVVFGLIFSLRIVGSVLEAVGGVNSKKK